MNKSGPVFVIGVAGGTASGKTTVCNKIMHHLQEKGEVVLLSQDAFYKSLTPEEKERVSEYNFDHPDSIDYIHLISCLKQLCDRQKVQIPVYDFNTHSRSKETEELCPADVIVLEGILVLAIPEVRELCHMKIFVETDDDVRLARRIVRDTAERGRNVANVIMQYTKFVKPMFDRYVAPSKKFADVIIPWSSGDNMVAIDLIVKHIKGKVTTGDLRCLYPNLVMIPSNFQVRAMQTIIRDKDCQGHDFQFYADRLIRLVVEFGLGFLEYTPKEVITPLGAKYAGVGFSKPLCGVSVIRSGETMENALRACCMGIKIGKVLVTRSPETTKRELVYEHLPADIARRFILLLDPVLASGETASIVIKLLLAKGVPEKNIIFLTLIAAAPGIHTVCRQFPNIRVVTSEIDEKLTDQGVWPGLGQFGDRYFGTSTNSVLFPLGPVSKQSVH